MINIRNLILVALCFFGLAACSKGGLEGTYSDTRDWVSIEFRKNGTAITESLGGKTEVKYELRDSEIVLEAGDGETQIFTMNEDGSIDSPFGTLRKQPE